MNQFKKQDRKHMRLAWYDYSQAGLYFVTICTKNRHQFFGNVKNGKMILNKYGYIVRDYWENIPDHFMNVKLRESITMPDHFHGIIRLDFSDNKLFLGNHLDVENQLDAINRTPTGIVKIGAVVRSFKAGCTYAINKMDNNFGVTIWQRNYYDHIIRDKNEYERISNYIKNNPKNW